MDDDSNSPYYKSTELLELSFMRLAASTLTLVCGGAATDLTLNGIIVG